MDGDKITKVHDKLKKFILTLPRSKRVHEDEYVTKCVFCGDSQNHKTHAHLYIGFKENGSVLYFCHRCPAKGTMTPETLKKLGIYDSELNEFFSISNKKNLRNYNKLKINNEVILVPEYKIPNNITEQDYAKITYFEQRTGIKITKQIIEDYYLILNLEEFLKSNNIPLTFYSKEQQFVIKELSKNFIGFLSSNKSMISFRSVRPTNFSKNKFNFVINPNYKKSFYYIPKSSIDLLSNSPKIILAEGPFDIICIKKRFFPSDSIDNIFVSVGGKAAYRKILSEIMSRTGFINAQILFFSDQDVDFEIYTDNILGPYRGLLHGFVYYNTKAKDFGDINDEVKIEKYKF